MASKSFGSFFYTPLNGWFTVRIDAIARAIDSAFSRHELGTSRSAIGLAIKGDGDAEMGHPIVVDDEAAHKIYAMVHGVTDGLGYWTLPRNGGSYKIYALQSFLKDYRLSVVANSANEWAVDGSISAGAIVVKVPSGGGTLAGLRSYLMGELGGEGPTTRSLMAVQGADNVAVRATDVMAATAITPPISWATSSLSASCALADLAVYRIETDSVVLHVDADAFGTTLDDYLPCSVVVELVVDGQLIQLSHLATATPVE